MDKIMVSKGKNTKFTELMVPIDCNACAKRLERKLHAVEGVNKVEIHKTQQKITVFGDASPEKILKAVRKVRKDAKLSSPIKTKSSNRDTKTTGYEDKYLHDWNNINHDNDNYLSQCSYSSYNAWPNLEENREEYCKVVQETESYCGEIDENQITHLFSDENPNACTIM